MDHKSPKGDWSKLTPDQQQLLEGQILPTARKWLTIWGLAAHGAKTLEFWGETFTIPESMKGRV